MEIFDIYNIPENILDNVGGKARGLYKMHKAGLKTPRGFVITNAIESDNFDNAVNYYLKSGIKNVAVRSSASNEDGIDFSSAGQYSTYLNIKNSNDFKTAIINCIKSLNSDTAESYSNFFSNSKSSAMNIVIQEMVEAEFAGVCFSSDPTGDKNHVLVEAVSGLGEALVSGQAQSSSFNIDKIKARKNANIDAIVKKRLAENINISHTSILDVAVQTVNLEGVFNCAIDTEWAIDKTGQLFWLQARPITTLDTASLDEFDPAFDFNNQVLTTCNIGEMLPGAVTPLTICTSVLSIDYGLRVMLKKSGVIKKITDLKEFSTVVPINNTLFMNLTPIYGIASNVMGASISQIELSICGKELEQTKDLKAQKTKKRNLFKRLKSTISYFKFLLGTKKAQKDLIKLIKKHDDPSFVNLIESSDIKSLYNIIDKNLFDLNTAMSCHYKTSSFSGAMSSALCDILEKQYKSKTEAKSILALLLEDIEGIESVDILRSLYNLSAALNLDYPNIKNYSEEQIEEILAQLKQGSDSQLKYDYFIKRHGHRAIRESELRSKSWAMDSLGLASQIKTIVSNSTTMQDKKENFTNSFNDVLSNFKGTKKGAVKMLTKQARKGCIVRESSKSKFVKVVDFFKIYYNRLSGLLVQNNILPDADLIFFFTHQELKKLIFDEDTKLIKTALSRRMLFPHQQELQYNEVYTSKPTPVDTFNVSALEGDVINGIPISRGKIEGIARVVKCLDDAKKLKKGDIMVAKFTDIGWSPYYCLISGLVTEVGSALSHGAVVAREYSIPLVSGIANATDKIKTGDSICVNGYNGTVTILSKD